MRPTADSDLLDDPAPSPDHPAAEAAPRWPGAAPATPATSLVGRRAELAELRRIVRGREGGLATLVGVGGVGKSRLAAEIAVDELGPLAGRVAFVSLDGVSDPSLVLPAIAGALGVVDEPGRPLAEPLREELGAAPTLLVLDTVEHVRSAAPALADLAARTPGLRILATSRITLGVPRERRVWIEPLPVPGPSESDPAVLERNPAAALFMARALAVRPDLEPTPATTALVCEICRRLDGIPLAIELAAAALRVLAPHQLLDQLTDRLAAPPAGEVEQETDDGATPARQRNMRAAMDWSLGLLPDPIIRLHRRVSVLAGAFDAGIAEAVLEQGERRGLAPLGIELDEGLRQLASASLLRSVAGNGRPPWVMLRTVRADARARLEASGEGLAMHWAHAYWVLALAEAAERDFPTPNEVEALDRLDEAHDDIREALEWAMEAGDGTFSVRLAGSLAEFWRTRGHLTEGRLRLAAALALGVDAPAQQRRKAIAGAGLLASYQGDYGLAESYLRQALAVAEAEGDREAMAVVLNWLGTNSYGAGALDAAEGFIIRSLELRRELGDAAGVATSLNALGGVYHFRGELDRAREVFRESLGIKQGLGNANSIAVSLTNLGLVERDAGRPDAASDAFAEAIAIWTQTGDRQRMAVGLHNAALVAFDRGLYAEAAELLDRANGVARELGDRAEMAYSQADRVRVDVQRGDLASARIALSEALPRAHTMGLRVIVPLALEGAGALAAAEGEDELAASLWAAAASERAASGFANMPADRRLLDGWIAGTRERLGDERWTAAWDEGARWSAERAVDALRPLVEPGPSPVPRAGRPGRRGAAV